MLFFKTQRAYITKAFFIALLSISVLHLSGCARDMSASTYSSTQVGEVYKSYQGTVINARKVKVKTSDSVDKNSTGIGLGAVTGGLAGSSIRGDYQAAAIVGGALVGGVAGAYAEDYLRTQDAMEYVIKLHDGSLRTVVQGLDLIYAPGQKVILIVSYKGRSRLIPDNSNSQVGVAQ